MPYISELLNNTITDSSDVKVGKLQDILIIPKDGAFEPLEFLVIKTPQKEIRFVPYEFVANFSSSEISLKNLFGKIALSELPAGKPYIYLKKEVLDKQIVDVAGTRVVRVNDLRIGNFENKTCVLGIDASFRGILRRLGLGDSFLSNLFTPGLIDWRQAKLVESKQGLKLNMAEEELSRLHPADLANIVEELDVKLGSKLLASLESSEAAKVLEELDPRLQTVLVKYLGPERAGKIMTQMSSDEFVDLIKTFSSAEAKKFLAQVGNGRAMHMQKLLAYPDNTAGGLMTLDYVSARPEWAALEAIEAIRKVSDRMRSIAHLYVTLEDGKFAGVVSLRRLMLAKPEEKIKDLAKTFPVYAFLKPSDKTAKIIRLMTKYNLYTAAVLDKDRKLVGVVTIDDIMRQLFPSA